MKDSWYIGDVKIPNRIIIAPMAGITNHAFRTIAKKFGAGLIVGEMISDQGIHYRNKKTLEMLNTHGDQHPISIQLFGGSIDSLVEAATYVAENTTTDIIDINMGCPVNKVVKTNAGSKWLQSPERVYKLIEALTKAVDIPITVKMRIGWDDQHINAIENALAAEKAGAKAVAMHGRTREQMYEGSANWDILKEVKQQLTIPFIGNGDIRSPEDAKKMLEEVGADAVMIGRGALGNPWLIKRVDHYLHTGELLKEPNPEEKMKLAEEHLENLIELKGEKVGVREFRQHAAYYLKGIPQAAKVKVAINQAESKLDVENIINQFLEESDLSKSKISFQ